MKVLTKSKMELLMKEFPDGGIVFARYEPDILRSELMVTDGSFGAREVIPRDGEVFDFDWNIAEYSENELFAVYDNNDVLQMIQTLTSGLKIKLQPYYYDYLND